MMEYPIEKFLVMNRRLPAPFNGVSKRQPHYHSFYAPSDTAATIYVPVVKMAMAAEGNNNGMDACAIGLDKRGLGLAEYKSSKKDVLHLVAYNPADGFITAGLFDMNDGKVSEYSYPNGKHDSTAILLAMLPHLLNDVEFDDTWNQLKSQKLEPENPIVIECLAILSDNIYRRLTDESCLSHMKLRIDSTGELPLLNKVQIDAEKYTVQKHLTGAFQVFREHKGKAIKTPKAIPHSRFVGCYANTGRRLSEREKALVPNLSAEYIIPEDIEFACKHASLSGKLPMKNFLFRGPAGTGKSAGARALAAGLALPYVYMTCSVNTELFDFIGQFIPCDGEDFEPDMDELKQGAVYDPEGTYFSITGMHKNDASTEDCYLAIIERSKPNMAGAYRYVETDFIRAIKHGYCVEIQEPSCIMQPGVLVGLNALLEQGGMITLPNGERIQRHPDTVVILTTNTDYEGCRPLNQSVIDRMNLVLDIDMPDELEMKKRAVALTGFDNDHYLSIMVKVVRDISEYCRKAGITDGSCGMRSLIDWISSVMVTDMPFESAMCTVISKAAETEDDQNEIIDTVLKQYFVEGQRLS